MKVLIVDDNFAARTILRKMLETMDGMRIVGETATSQDALDMVLDVNPDIVMLETTVDGDLGLVDIVKQMVLIKPDVKIILCTDEIGKEFVMPGIDAGAIDFIGKPYKKEQIERPIQRVIIEL